MSKHELTPSQEAILRNMVITDETPGTILHDFQVLVDFATESPQQLTEAKMLPLNVLQLLNERLKRQTQPGFIRAHPKAYPHIHGLVWLLQATGLAMIDTRPRKPKLIIDQQSVDSWNKLNVEERYFSLLESYLWRWNPATTGERLNALGFLYPFAAWNNFYISIATNNWQHKEWMERIRYWPQSRILALMELFGFLTIEDAPTLPRKGWQIANINTTTWGGALLALLQSLLLRRDNIFYDRLMEVQSGVLQPLIQPYQPHWQHTLQMPEVAFQNGLYVFRVSLGTNLWRQITISARNTLHDFSKAILTAYQLDQKYLYHFAYNYSATLREVSHPSMDNQFGADKIRIGELLEIGGFQMSFHYDFEDGKVFKILLEHIHLPDSNVQEYQITNSYGHMPER